MIRIGDRLLFVKPRFSRVLIGKNTQAARIQLRIQLADAKPTLTSLSILLLDRDRSANLNGVFPRILGGDGCSAAGAIAVRFATRQKARLFRKQTAIARYVAELLALRFVTWFSVPRSQFRFVRGEPTRFKSTGQATRRFWARCGTKLTFEYDEFLDEIDVTTCSLDEPNRLPPQDHTYTNNKLSWIKQSGHRIEFVRSAGDP